MAGFATRHGIHDAPAQQRIAEIIRRIEADGIRTVRIGFADQHGVIRGKSFAADQIGALFEDGMTAPSSLLLKDLAHRTVLPVWTNEATGLAGMAGIGDILAIPDPARFHILPWLDDTAWIQADIYHKDGTPSPLDTRAIARRAEAALATTGLQFRAGLEIEAHVYRLDARALTPADIGQPGTPPEVTVLNRGYQLLTEHYADTLDPVLTLIRDTCDALAIPIRSLEVEFGPSQIEFTCGARPGIGAADDMVLLRAALRQALARHGYHISFMCRPAISGSFASGWHLHQSVADSAGANLFMPEEDGAMSQTASGWIAGLLHHAPAMSLFAVPTITGYKRYRAHSLAPERISWSHDGRGALVRALCRAGDTASRIENRGGEPAANPYLYLASQMFAGLDGVTGGRTPPPAVADAYDSALPRLPSSLDAALALARADDFVTACFGNIFMSCYGAIKQAELDSFAAHVSDWEHRAYFAAF
ncbi:MAG: glutamine synthetase [Candidatus Puniceispirillum sp. TMED245]|nr:MAG: glutamine synthetase [Candidatus Puniceispirillum sp. TMED245]